jgi:hypothetical protein
VAINLRPESQLALTIKNNLMALGDSPMVNLFGGIYTEQGFLGPAKLMTGYLFSSEIFSTFRAPKFMTWQLSAKNDDARKFG